MIVAFHKPYGVLCQFTVDRPGRRTLAAFGFPTDMYPIGRLDLDSEGLLLLSDDGRDTTRLLGPTSTVWKKYLVQVEGIPSVPDLERLKSGVPVLGRRTLPARVSSAPIGMDIPARVPPVRFRASIPTSWLTIGIREGRNRQIRKMTAAVGFPTLRLIRIGIGPVELGILPAGSWRVLEKREVRSLFS